MAFIRCLTLQGGVMGAMTIEVKEMFGLALHGGWIGQIGVVPDVFLIVLMKTLHVAIALGMPHGRENQLGSDHERQTDTLAQDIRMGKAPAKTGFIVHLGVGGKP